MGVPNVEEELLAFSRLSDKFLRGVDINDRSAPRIIWHIIRLARHAEQRLEFDVHRPRGWSWAGFRIMINTLALGSVEPSQLASILGVSRPTVTSNLDKLERDGFLTRTPDPSNGRNVQVKLTERGRLAVEQVVPLHGAVERQLVSGLTPEDRAQLEHLLHLMLASLRDGPDGEPRRNPKSFRFD